MCSKSSVPLSVSTLSGGKRRGARSPDIEIAPASRTDDPAVMEARALLEVTSKDAFGSINSDDVPVQPLTVVNEWMSISEGATDAALDSSS
ncbi:Phosphoadenylyl-sulfate reductase, putative [Babesia ovata]|uniref:Phosphoadenylyl-sulfate reductase, putative n=1 Tax=Babesia ovata TaxID=189622 RepID=A0A2H6KDY9_9APIC|nr:Phosphoadenylyl-sulfate reductase, putative [Babesia ovata]GBE61206.1 Phosphoadenylyl-sulfate reductase, putative [Babesia ovata]